MYLWLGYFHMAKLFGDCGELHSQIPSLILQSQLALPAELLNATGCTWWSWHPRCWFFILALPVKSSRNHCYFWTGWPSTTTVSLVAQVLPHPQILQLFAIKLTRFLNFPSRSIACLLVSFQWRYHGHRVRRCIQNQMHTALRCLWLHYLYLLSPLSKDWYLKTLGVG